MGEEDRVRKMGEEDVKEDGRRKIGRKMGVNEKKASFKS